MDESCDIESITDQIHSDGFAIVKQVYDQSEILDVVASLELTLTNLDSERAGSIRTRDGIVYAARNFLSIFPLAAEIWDRPILRQFLQQILGSSCGLVRALYFDKPPEQGWTLPWHKDLTIAVASTDVETALFRNPTLKAGVSHFEAPESVLQNMLTLRIHLDGADLENGALMVMPQSHQSKNVEPQSNQQSTMINTQAGDVFIMRPMLSHCSGNSNGQVNRHRRVIHLEFAASKTLPDGVQWNSFLSVN